MMLAAQPSPASVAPQPVIPEAILQSRLLVGSNGFGIFEGLPDPYTFQHLLAEAVEMYPSAGVQQSGEPDCEDLRGGKPRRSLLTSTAGPIQDAWYAGEPLRRFLSAQTGLPVAPSGNRGSYSYYARTGDFLDVHRDIETCDVAVITALHDNSDLLSQGGALALYPGRIFEPLSAIRDRPREGACLVKLRPGQTLIMFGGVIPHTLLPVVEGQIRIISVLCFRALV